MGVNWKSHQTIEVTLRQVDTRYCTALAHTVPLHLQAPTYRLVVSDQFVISWTVETVGKLVSCISVDSGY